MKKRVIWKFELEFDPAPFKVSKCEAMIPPNAMFLHMAIQHGTIMVWAMVDPDEPTKPRRFWKIGTGQEMEHKDWNRLDYRGTVHQQQWVWHIFEEMRGLGAGGGRLGAKITDSHSADTTNIRLEIPIGDNVDPQSIARVEEVKRKQKELLEKHLRAKLEEGFLHGPKIPPPTMPPEYVRQAQMFGQSLLEPPKFTMGTMGAPGPEPGVLKPSDEQALKWLKQIEKMKKAQERKGTGDI